MSEHARALIELCERPWADLGDAERDVFDAWLSGARGEDLYMLMRFARRRWQRNSAPSSPTFAAITETEEEK